jgi:nitroreductase
LPSKEQVEILLKGRRSIRVYKDQAVAKEEIEKTPGLQPLRSFRINRQPVNWLVISGNERVREMTASVVAWMEAAAG